jgi:uncharacterized protein (UPF0335 family)
MKSIQEAVASVQNAFPSIYTKDDVVKLLTSIEIESPKSGFKVTKDQIEELVENLQNRIERNANNLDTSDAVDTSSAEFSIGYGNCIELDSIDVYADQIASEMMSGVQDVIEDFFEKLEQVEEEETEDVEEDIPEGEVV